MAIPYGVSVTKSHAYDLLEEGTHCPNCYVEILPTQFVYFHRACSNIVCASCFETNLSPVLGSDVCLICHAQLAEPFAEDGLPNWPFTYTGIPLSQFSDHPSTGVQGPQGLCTARGGPADDAMVWSPLASSPKTCPKSGTGLSATGSNSAIVAAAPSTATFTDYIMRLAAGIDEQERKLGDLEGQRGTVRNNGRITRQNSPTFKPPKILSPMDLDSPDSARRNMTNPGYQYNNKNDDQNTFGSSLMNDTAGGQQYALTSWNQPNTTTQYENGTQTEPQPTPPSPPPRGPKHPHKRKTDGPVHEDSIDNPDDGKRPNKVRLKEHQKMPRPVQHGKFGGNFSREARDPASEHHHLHHWQSQPQTQHDAHQQQQQQRQQQPRQSRHSSSQKRRGRPPHGNQPQSRDRQQRSTHPPNAVFPPRSNDNGNIFGVKANTFHDPHHHNDSHKARFNRSEKKRRRDQPPNLNKSVRFGVGTGSSVE